MSIKTFVEQNFTIAETAMLASSMGWSAYSMTWHLNHPERWSATTVRLWAQVVVADNEKKQYSWWVENYQLGTEKAILNVG